MSSLKRAGLIETQNGVPGCHLAKPAAKITLLEIYLAVQKKTAALRFDFHANPNPNFPVGRNIRDAMDAPLRDVQITMKQTLEIYTLKDVSDNIARHR